MFRIFEDRSQFSSVYELFEQEWESQDVTFDREALTFEKVREDFKNKQHKGQKPVIHNRLRKVIWWSSGIAAGIAILLGLFVWGQDDFHEVIYQTGFAETKEIVLNDNSSVLLNANSRIVWNEDWEKTGIRELELEGEAFFEVNRINQEEKGNTTDAGHLLP